MLISKSTDEGYTEPFNVRNIFKAFIGSDIDTDNRLSYSGSWCELNPNKSPCEIATHVSTGGSGNPILKYFDKYVYIININNTNMKTLTYSCSISSQRQDYYWKWRYSFESTDSGTIIIKKDGTKRYVGWKKNGILENVPQNVDLEPDDSLAIVFVTAILEKTNGKTANLIPNDTVVTFGIQSEEA